MKKRTRKVLAYVTRGHELLVLDHVDYPDAGRKVPAGAVQAGESLEEAAFREVAEETGLTEVRLVQRLGDFEYDMGEYGRREVQLRSVFHFEVTSSTADQWDHFERHDGTTEPTRFRLHWIDIDDPALQLTAGQGEALERLNTTFRR